MTFALRDYFQLVVDETEASHRASLSTRRAISAAVFLNTLPDRVFETYRNSDPRKVRDAMDLPEYRDRIEKECTDLQILHALCRFEAAAPSLVRKTIEVSDAESKKLAIGDFMISLYNGLSVYAILVRLPDGKEIRFDELIDRAVAWWKNEFAARGL